MDDSQIPLARFAVERGHQCGTFPAMWIRTKRSAQMCKRENLRLVSPIGGKCVMDTGSDEIHANVCLGVIGVTISICTQVHKVQRCKFKCTP